MPNLKYVARERQTQKMYINFHDSNLKSHTV